MSDRNNSAVIAAGSLVFLICGAIFGYLAGGKPSPLALAAPAVIGWLAALAAARPLVDAERRTALYFAFGVLALMIFFIHQTYGYTGRVRNFPLIIGYTGVAICLLDILSLTRTSVGLWRPVYARLYLSAVRAGLQIRTLSGHRLYHAIGLVTG